MASSVEICNLALSHLAVGKEIASLTERSQEASACNRLYETTRDMVLRGFHWPFANRTIALGLVTDSDDDDHPTTEWDFSYRYPTDCANLIRIESGVRNDTRQSRVPFKVAQDDAGKLIYTDKEDAVLVYTKLETNSELYTADFVMAVSLLLASFIAPRITAGDPFKLGARALGLYATHMESTRANAVNEEQADEQPDSEFIRARE